MWFGNYNRVVYIWYMKRFLLYICHYFDYWSVHRWSMCKSWFVLMCQLNIVLFGIFATFAVSFRLIFTMEISIPETTVVIMRQYLESWPWSRVTAIRPTKSAKFRSICFTVLGICWVYNCWIILVAASDDSNTWNIHICCYICIHKFRRIQVLCMILRAPAGLTFDPINS